MRDTRYSLLGAIWLGVAMTGVGGDCAAASAPFGCGEATKPRERLICGDAALAELDGWLGRVYAQRAALLSASGAEGLRESERSWLRYVAAVCSLAVPDGADPRRRLQSCTEERYQERLEQLAKVGVRIGPFVFTRVDMFAASASNDGEGTVPGFAIEHVGYPQIDSPLSATARAWNRAIMKELPGSADCGQGDANLDYELGYASTALISVEWRDYTYCHGTPHGFRGARTQNILLLPLPHQLTAADVFGADHG